MIRSVTTAVLVLTAVLSACSGSSNVKPDRLALDRLEAVARTHAPNDQFTLRHNPAACDCPPFEVLLDGTWHRTFLEPNDPDGPVAALSADLASAAARGDASATAVIRGRLAKGARLAPTRAPCLVLRLVEVCPANGCPPGP